MTPKKKENFDPPRSTSPNSSEATVSEAAHVATEIASNESPEKADMVVLPPSWRVMRVHQSGGEYTNGKLVCVLNAAETKDGKVTVHVATRRMDGKRPTAIELQQVKRALFDDRRGPIVENNQLFPTSELTRQLWQVIGAEFFDPAMVEPDSLQ